MISKKISLMKEKSHQSPSKKEKPSGSQNNSLLMRSLINHGKKNLSGKLKDKIKKKAKEKARIIYPLKKKKQKSRKIGYR